MQKADRAPRCIAIYEAERSPWIPAHTFVACFVSLAWLFFAWSVRDALSLPAERCLISGIQINYDEVSQLMTNMCFTVIGALFSDSCEFLCVSDVWILCDFGLYFACLVVNLLCAATEVGIYGWQWYGIRKNTRRPDWIIVIKHHGLLSNNNCIRHYFASGSLGSHVDAIMANPADGGYLNPVREAGVVRGDGNRIEWTAYALVCVNI